MTLPQEKIQKTNNWWFLKRIAFLWLDKNKKNQVAKNIIEEWNFGKLYWIQLILSSIICTLWLLINSIPVIIWAMLIAPIMLPIKTISFSISTWNKHLYKKWLFFALISIIISILIAIIVSYFTPLTNLTTEILSRTSPTIIDLAIALASGIIAFISLWYEKLRENIAWVAMATALIPPLCVTWIWLNLINIAVFQGSFLLFLTNFVAIIFVGILIFFFFWFSAHWYKWKERSISWIAIALISILLISVPLVNSMKSIVYDIQTTQTIEKNTNDFIQSIDKRIEIKNIWYQNLKENKILIETTINVPNTTIITEKNRDDLSKILAASTNKSVDLELNIVTLSSVVIETTKEPSKEETAQKEIKNKIKEYTWVIIIDSNIAFDNSPIIYLNLFSEIQQDKETIKNKLENIAKKLLWEDTVTIIIWTTNTETKKIIKEDKSIIQTKEIINKNLINAYITSISINQITEWTWDIVTTLIDLKISSWTGKQSLEEQLKNIKNKLEETFQLPFSIKSSTIYTSELFLK